MDNLKPLFWDWSYGDGGKTRAVCRAKSPSHEYIIRMGDRADVYYVDYRKFDNDEDSDNRKDEQPVFSSVGAAQDWAQSTHYPSKMQPYVKPDSITDIANWFKAAKPEPTFNDAMTQYGCHIEEVCEMLDAMGDRIEAHRLTQLADWYKQTEYKDKPKPYTTNIEVLDALCDQIVTATGVAYMMGFDIQGALKEVNASNWSKFVDGKAVTAENGKIIKGSDYFKPELDKFVGGSEND